MTISAIYTGDVTHARHRPRRHRLRYRVFSLLLDLDELPVLSKQSWLFGYNRAALFSFHDCDHGDGSIGSLRSWVEQQVVGAGLIIGRPSISVLCYPRILGYVFNPLTMYFCFDATRQLQAVLYEVCNTYGERHTYVIPAGTDAAVLRQTAPKLHFVSPFMPPDCTYNFLIRPPGDRVLISIAEDDAEGLLLNAVFSGRRQEWTEGGLLRLFFAYPFMTLKVTVAIHWEALKLIIKRVPLFNHHEAPQRRVSTHHPTGDSQPQRVRQGG